LNQTIYVSAELTTVAN